MLRHHRSGSFRLDNMSHIACAVGLLFVVCAGTSLAEDDPPAGAANVVGVDGTVGVEMSRGAIDS